MEEKMKDIDQPINLTERYLYGINIRLNAICDMLGSIIDYIADKEGIAVENGQIKEITPEVKKKKVK